MNRTVFNTVIAILGGLIGFLFGQLTVLFWALLALSLIDYVTGVMTALKQHTLSSAIGYVGIAKKVLIFALVAVAHIVDAYVICKGSAVMAATLLYYIANEGISITENAANLGVPLPKKLVSVLQQIKKTADEDSDNVQK